MNPMTRYRRIEARRLGLRPGVIAAGLAALLVALTHLVLPRLPAGVLDFIALAFQLDDFAGVVLLNEILIPLFAVYVLGMLGMLGALVAPRENGELELLLAKPIGGAGLLAARVWPIVLSSAAVGVATSLAVALSIALIPSAELSALDALGASLALTAVAVFELGLLAAVLVGVRDSFYAIALGFGIWFVPVMPTAAYLYRPDVFEGAPQLTTAIVLSSAVWHAEVLALAGPLALAAALLACVGLVRLAGWRLARAEA
ncbi:hypothetical protein [Haliangium ochraceum]|uniref:Uncharacterized protein n=1 Tax=Haliangium ochraceum (strain DSM 14365 / JCM 11303 / SMP-2) TaxID=502025 RepID=D0LIR3_HALO1|nr:hypothetical protein [Haliangium ochraceum]ACY12942.1 hypothetical protein Hoch_0301 [Haliangium ochraceum DSM 14365]